MWWPEGGGKGEVLTANETVGARWTRGGGELAEKPAYQAGHNQWHKQTVVGRVCLIQRRMRRRLNHKVEVMPGVVGSRKRGGSENGRKPTETCWLHVDHGMKRKPHAKDHAKVVTLGSLSSTPCLLIPRPAL